MSQPSTRRTLVIGEALIDIVHERDGSVAEHVGGSPLNVAVGLARLGHRACLATHIGPDAHGRLIRGLLAGEHVELTDSSIDLTSTSTAKATLADDGSASYEFSLQWPAVTSLPSDVGHVHTGSIGASLEPGAASVLEALRSYHDDATTSFDPNVRPTLMATPEAERARVEAFLPHVDVVKSSDEDALWLHPDTSIEQIAEHWALFGPNVVIITRGGDGAHVRIGSQVREIPGRTVEVADTVGAGDSFMSGLLSGLADAGLIGGAPARERLRKATLDDVQPAVDRAILTSSITVTRHGSQPPHRHEID